MYFRFARNWHKNVRTRPKISDPISRRRRKRMFQRLLHFVCFRFRAESIAREEVFFFFRKDVKIQRVMCPMVEEIMEKWLLLTCLGTNLRISVRSFFSFDMKREIKKNLICGGRMYSSTGLTQFLSPRKFLEHIEETFQRIEIDYIPTYFSFGVSSVFRWGWRWSWKKPTTVLECGDERFF